MTSVKSVWHSYLFVWNNAMAMEHWHLLNGKFKMCHITNILLLQMNLWEQEAVNLETFYSTVLRGMHAP